MIRVIPLAIVWLLVGNGLLEAQSTATETSKDSASAPAEASDVSSADLDTIRKQSEGFVSAFNQHDAPQVALLWTEDGEYVDQDGNRFVGRKQIEKAYADFFSNNPDVRIRVVIDSLTQVSPTVIIEDGRALSSTVSESAGVSTYTAVHVKSNGSWLMASVRDMWHDAPPAASSAADLQWLIGSWVAEEHGVKVDSEFRWIADHQFVQRNYTTTQLDGSKTSGVQIIGWNAQGGHVQSWEFSPDGGHAIGIWYPTESGWIAEMTGTTGGAIPTLAVNRYTRLDDNAYAWQSSQRFVGEVALPDTDEVVVKRKQGAKQ